MSPIKSICAIFMCMAVVSLTSAQNHVDSRTIMEYIEDEKLSTLVTFVKATGLDAVLNNKNGPAMTLFAPTEAAWGKLPVDVISGVASNSTLLKMVLLGHVVDQTVFSLYIRDGDSRTNLNGGKLNFRIYGNGARTVNGAFLIGSDVALANGLVHIIDDVIINPDTNIGEYIATHDSDFKDLFGMLVLGRLFASLETSPGPFTLFAPNDAAFEKIRGDIPALINDRDALSNVLKSHMIDSIYWSVGLTDGMVLPTVNGDSLVVSIQNQEVRINGSLVIQADVKTSNGVIHVIDQVIA